MASKNMKKLKRKLLQQPTEPNVAPEQYPRNMTKLFDKNKFKEEMQGWPSHFTTKRVK